MLIASVIKSNESPNIDVVLFKDKYSEVVEYALSKNLSPTSLWSVGKRLFSIPFYSFFAFLPAYLLRMCSVAAFRGL